MKQLIERYRNNVVVINNSMVTVGCRPPPTFWEAAADAILLKRLRPFRNPLESDLETEAGSERDEPDTDHDPFENQQHKFELERFVNVPRLMENGNDIVSVKSFKSGDD